MKSVEIVVALACALGLGFATQASPQHAHDHHAAPAATATATAPAPAPAPAQRWAPDASLREGIRRAHAAVDELRHYEMGHMSAPMAVDRAASVESAVAFMLAHCKLAPEPDAALHGILVPLLGAARTLKLDPKNVAAVADMRDALARYPQYFDDPGWDAPAPVMHEMHDEP